jgi:hypothetical protein
LSFMDLCTSLLSSGSLPDLPKSHSVIGLS